MISSSVICLMENLHSKNIFGLIHCQGHVMCRGESQNRGKLDNFGRKIAHLQCFNYPKVPFN